MAFQLKKDLDLYSPVFNDLNVVVYETTYASKIDFRYVFDVYISGVPDFLRFKVNIHPTTKNGYLNLTRVLSSYVENYINDGNTFIAVNTGNGFGLREIQIKYGYEYRASVDAPLVVYDNILVGGDRFVWNCALPYNQWLDFDFNEWDLNNGTTGKFLTDNVNENYLKTTDTAFASVIMSSAYTFDYTIVKTYDSSDVLIDTYRLNNQLAQNNIYSRYTLIGTGGACLNSVVLGLVSGSQPIIDTAVSRYTVQCFNATGDVAISNILTYYIDDCERYPTKRLIYLNKYGGYDSFSFKLINTESIDIERKTFKVNPNRETTNGITYSKRDKTNQTYYTKYSDKIKLQSDWISENESNYLQQLLTSNNIYLDNGDGTLSSVKGITQKNYTYKKTKSDKLFNLSIDIEMSSDNYTQSL